jgi:predicted nucleic acid-binding protein
VVVDASALVELLLYRSRAAAVRDVIDGAVSLQAPHLVQSEVLHALRTGVLRRSVEASRAAGALDDLESLPILHHSHAPLNRRVWRLRENFTAYDATYVALADVLDAPLLTADARLARAAERLVRVILV